MYRDPINCSWFIYEETSKASENLAEILVTPSEQNNHLLRNLKTTQITMDSYSRRFHLTQKA